ncbi:transposase (plasmid) [Halarchaeum sp. CBA1220]|uniref:zinc ribbon domain-containing protein n=1 Tax=Halarchaeum sp. CBA1220 TaxID=1853682 RepID=UPI001313E233|nr:zinc ribbon domain-containing protein [Halarchaeum sp. CBA1220]QLC35753.1 transposase [Halarchaeum sp. CBA1220]
MKRLAVAAPADADPDVAGALVAGGGVERKLYNLLGNSLGALASQPIDTYEFEGALVEAYRARLTERARVVTASVVEYVTQVGADVVALEDIDYADRPLAECARGDVEAGDWLLPWFRACLEAALAAVGVRVERVDPTDSTRECHVCGALTDVGRATIRCETPDCPVNRVCRDRSAAVTLARRAGGEGTT